MLLDFRRPVESKSVSWFSLQELVDEISSFKRPAFGQVASFDLYLLSKDHISDLLASSSDVGPPAQHELVTDDTQGEIVNRVGVILAAHHFGCHIARCSRRILGIF